MATTVFLNVNLFNLFKRLFKSIGFIANTILRGVNFILIPTTLLSQVDSSIGGKNGINSIYGKNLVGTFYQPNLVIIDPLILNSLP